MPSTSDSQFLGEADIALNAPVGLLLDETRFWGQADQIKIVTEVNIAHLPDLDIKIESRAGGGFEPGGPLTFAPSLAIPVDPKDLLPDDPTQPAPVSPSGVAHADPSILSNSKEANSYVLESVRLLEDDRLDVRFREDVPPFEQRQPSHKSFRISVATATVELRWIDLLSGKLHDSRLAELAVNERLRAALLNTYGRIQIKQALDLTSRRMLETYGDVKLLGFDFTPATFWMFVVAFYAIFLGAIAIHLTHPYGEQKDEATTFGLHLFLDVLTARVALWIAVPVIALLLVMPDQNSFGSTGYWCSLILICLGGVAVTRLSSKIARTVTPATT